MSRGERHLPKVISILERVIRLHLVFVRGERFSRVSSFQRNQLRRRGMGYYESSEVVVRRLKELVDDTRQYVQNNKSRVLLKVPSLVTKIKMSFHLSESLQEIELVQYIHHLLLGSEQTVVSGKRNILRSVFLFLKFFLSSGSLVVVNFLTYVSYTIRLGHSRLLSPTGPPNPSKSTGFPTYMTIFCHPILSSVKSFFLTPYWSVLLTHLYWVDPRCRPP